MTAKQLLEDINKKISNRDIFKYNREFLITSLIQASNRLMGKIIYETHDVELCNQVIAQYRTILKFVFINDNLSGTIPANKEKVINQFENTIWEFVERYTPVRNYLEQCIIGTRKIEYNDKENLYIEKEYDSTSDYSRSIDKVKKYDSEDIKNYVLGSLKKYLINNKKANPFKDRYIISLMDKYIQASWLDSEIKFDYDFNDFKYSELIKFCAALTLISHYYELMSLKYSYGKIEKDELIYGLSRLTDLDEGKIELFLRYQTYDYNYQKNKLTLIQSLILINEYYYFYPITLTIGMLPIKMYRLICDYDRKKYEKIISAIAKKKEEQMTDDIMNILSKYNVSMVKNFQYKEEKNIKAEYDLLIKDNDTNNLYITEFKWFYVGDGEEDHEKLDNKIKQAVGDRKIKNKFIYDNKKGFVKEVLISQNYIGKRNYEMQVIDFETLKISVEYNNTFDNLMNYIDEKKFINLLQLENFEEKIEIEDYNFKIYRIAHKRYSYDLY